MTFVSFAPNFEDVLLWRALRDQAAGYYADIGAADADHGSVTRAFHERGWRGLNVTPIASAHRRLLAQRPRDVTLLQAEGGPLSALLDEHAPADIHFLRIDAHGAEQAVLAGADFSRKRPWIILVRASPEPAGAAWEPGLLAAGYGFVWFDGLSRFYVAAERHARLAGHFATPPNASDDFLRASDTEAAIRIARAEAQIGLLAQRSAATEARLRAETRDLMIERSVSGQRKLYIDSLELALNAERHRANQAESWLSSMRSSSSWLVTAPLRKLAGLRRRGPQIAPPEFIATPQSLPPRSPEVIEPQPKPGPPVPARRPAAGQVLRRVHQYHPGSAQGDAVTNSMLLIQRLLREAGLESEIYCDHVDPDMSELLRPASTLPRHDGYVLIVHVSLGFRHFDEIAGLAASKVLMYHNITPPELLTQAPVLQEFARLGHRQLPMWRPLMAAALAVSEYNALDLRRHGFPVVRTCPLLFDIDAMLATAAQPVAPRADDAFTVLFVGRLVESKAQNDLVAAFAAFRQRFARPCRLVLVGRVGSSEDAFMVGLQRMIAELDLADDVVLTGMIDDNRLRECYRHADLYVSLSHHEGFGVPLIEAMAHDVPVLAWPCGAVPYTIGDSRDLLADRAPDTVAGRILELALDPERRRAIARRQRRSLDRFRLAHHLPVLMEALALAGAAPPPPAALRELLDDGMRFTVIGHVNGSYSLASVNRGLARSIEAVRPGRVRLVPVEGSVTTDISGVPAAAAEAVAMLVSRPKPETGPVAVISQHYPVHVPEDGGDVAMALFFWEETVIPMATVRTLNSGFRTVLAPSGFVAKTLIDSGVRVPVRRMGQSPELTAFRALGEERRERVRPPGPVRLLHVSSCFPRKGVDVLLAAFARAFRRGDAVELVIKGFPNPHNDVEERVATLRATDPDAAEIVLINRDLDAAAMLDLYRQADAMVLPTRGEGFNLPAAEAMAARLPLIVTGFGGQQDFCDDGTARLLAWRHAPSGSHLASGMSLWAEPSEDDLVAAMREVVEAYATATTPDPTAVWPARVRAAASRIGATMSDAALTGSLARAAAEAIAAPPQAPARMAWITTWDVRCGVAEYARHLLSAWPENGGTGEVVMISDTRTVLEPDAAPRRRIGWHIGDAHNLPKTEAVLAQEDPEIVVIQHQPGFLPWPDLAALLRSDALTRRVVSVTLHNTSHIETLGRAERRDLVEALHGAQRVIVHGIADLERLRGFGLQANVVMMPHGVPSLPPQVGATRELPPESAPVIGCYGFFLPRKGIAELIAAVAILRQTWPGLQLRLVNARYGTPESEAEIAHCQQAALAAGVADAIQWHTEFLPAAQSQALLQGCDLVVLPYQSSGEASSAALRSALAAGVPVAVTPVSVFDDAGPAVTRLSGTGPAAIAEGVRLLLQQTEARARQLARATAWMGENAWPLVAERMQGMLLGLLASR